MKEYKPEQLYIVELATLTYKKNIYKNCDTAIFNENNKVKRIAIYNEPFYYDALTFSNFGDIMSHNWSNMERHMDCYYLKSACSLQISEYKVKLNWLSVNDIINLNDRMNEDLEKNNTDKKDPVLKLILKTKRMMLKYIISEDEKEEINNRLYECGSEYINEIKSIKDNRTYNAVRLSLITRIVSQIADIELQITSHLKIHQKLYEEEVEEFKRSFDR